MTGWDVQDTVWRVRDDVADALSKACSDVFASMPYVLCEYGDFIYCVRKGANTVHVRPDLSGRPQQSMSFATTLPKRKALTDSASPEATVPLPRKTASGRPTASIYDSPSITLGEFRERVRDVFNPETKRRRERGDAFLKGM